MENNENLKYKGNSRKKTGRKAFPVLLCAIAVLAIVICLGLWSMSSTGSGRVFPVYITEVLASNSRYPNEDGRCCDFIEIYNSADYPVDLTGFQLGDISGTTRYSFPSGTIIGSGEYLVVYCDKTIEEEGYARFGISRAGGESIYLLTSSNAVADSVVTLEMGADESMILLDSGEWALSTNITPGLPNDAASEPGEAHYNAAVSPVRISELMTGNAVYPNTDGLCTDWVELWNTSAEAVDISGYILSDNASVDKYVFPEGTVLPAGGYIVVYCTDKAQGDFVADFGLSQLGEEYVVLKDARERIIEIVDTVVLTDLESMALNSDGVWTVTDVCSPGFENSEAGKERYLASIGVGSSSVVISELMAASQSVLTDCQGRFSDWVELYNPTDSAVVLTGWFLSDDPTDITKWQFPELVLQPGARVVIYCSGRDMVRDGQIHAGFSLSAGGETLILSTNLGVTADTVTFGASESNTAFVVEEGSGELLVTQYPTPGYPNDEAGYEAFCATLTAQGPLAIWEVMTSNDTYLAQALGECYDWVELRNISDASVNLSDYSITEDADTPGMYVLPDVVLGPGESYVIILSGDESLSTSKYYHAGFALNAKEDTLFLFDSNETLLDYVLLLDIPLGYSYGRSDSNGGFFYMVPTPNKTNNAGYRMISDEPTADVTAGVYVSEEACQLTLCADGDIYYTTDGSDPSTKSKHYEGTITVDKTTVIRAISVEEGKLPSDIYTTTFVIAEPHSIPVVSLVTDPENLWGSNGIYKDNDLDVKELKKAANLSYVGDDGSFSLDCEISLRGATSALYADKKSFTVRFRDNYDGALNYDVFEDGEVTLFSSLMLRAARESTFSTHMHDTMMAAAGYQMGSSTLTLKYKYVALYINGEYWGLYAIREHHSVEYYATYQEVPVESVTMVSKWIESGTELYDLFRYASKNTFASSSAYEYACSMLDIDSFIDWIILEAYCGNIDINENMRYYYSSVDGLWRCGLNDVDLGWESKQTFKAVTEAFHHSKIVNALLANKDFQDRLATRLAELLAGPLSDENMTALLNSMAAEIEDEIPLDYERWDATLSVWYRMIDGMRDYCDGRAVRMINGLCNELGFTNAQKQYYFGDLLN